MKITTHRLLLAAFSGLLSLCGAQASDHSYHTNVSDVEVEDAVKGETYNKGPVSYFSSDKKSECSACASCATCSTCASDSAAATTTTTAAAVTSTTSEGRHIKYILDGKPVYEDGAKGDSGQQGCGCEQGVATPVAVVMTSMISDAHHVGTSAITTAIDNLGNAGWREAQAFLIQSGKDAVPYLIEALGKSGVAYNLGGHTKADAGRAPRQLTIADVCAQLLEEIVTNHSNYQGETPGANQQAWQEWWSKNAAGVAFGS